MLSGPTQGISREIQKIPSQNCHLPPMRYPGTSTYPIILFPFRTSTELSLSYVMSSPVITPRQRACMVVDFLEVGVPRLQNATLGVTPLYLIICPWPLGLVFFLMMIHLCLCFAAAEPSHPSAAQKYRHTTTQLEVPLSCSGTTDASSSSLFPVTQTLLLTTCLVLGSWYWKI